MSTELAERILRDLKGYLGITVSHPRFTRELRVIGVAANASEHGWTNMPDEMRIKDRTVYCCQVGLSADPIFLFEDEVTVVDAPAYVVVGAMLDRIADIRTERALTPCDVIDILEGRSINPDEWDEP